MEINGRAIADNILADVKARVSEMHQKYHSIPRLAVVRVGEDPAVSSYVSQKERTAQKIGIDVIVYPYPETVSEEELLKKLEELDKDTRVNGLILQLPIPKNLDQQKLLLAISPTKDVDGFHPHTKFTVPVASAIFTILEYICDMSEPLQEISFLPWLKNQTIVILGKGKTGGMPISNLLQSKDITPSIIDSTTENAEEIIKKADIIISAVGKNNTVKKHSIKPGAILISIGMTKGEDGKFYGDYTSDEIKDIAGFYTPVPGGVGPVNVAKLMENVVQAAENSLQ